MINRPVDAIARRARISRSMAGSRARLSIRGVLRRRYPYPRIHNVREKFMMRPPRRFGRQTSCQPMSGSGTDQLCQPVRKNFRYWRLTGSVGGCRSFSVDAEWTLGSECRNERNAPIALILSIASTKS